jgi:hypothetical protein
MSRELRMIAERETEWVISRQCEKLSASESQELRALCIAFLAELESRNRPICDFYHVFAIEAFIGRLGE